MEIQSLTQTYGNVLDFSYLNKILPYDRDQKINLSNLNIEEEISNLLNEMNSIDIRSIPFDKWDFIVVFSAAILEVAGDFLISDVNNKDSLSSKMSDKNSALGKQFSNMHDKFDHSGNPLDYQGPKFGGGDHRSRQFGHDLLMLPFALFMLSKGQFIDGFYENGSFNWVTSKLNQYGSEYIGMDPQEAIINYFLHMFADFFSAKSLPIPGFSLLTHFPVRDVRKVANDLYKDGLNLRSLLMQGIPVAFTELSIWMYNSLKYKDSDYSKEAIKNKKEKLLLIVHSIATAVNIGKVVITKNPTSLNFIMIVRTISLVWKVIKYEIEITQKSKEKLNLSVLKVKFETLQTLI